MTQIDTHAAPPIHDKDLVPRMMVRAMLALVLTVLTVVTIARVTGQPLIATLPEGKIIIQREIVLSGDMSGAAQVHAPDGTLIADLSPEEGGFISGVYRVLLHERKKTGVAPDAPVLLLQKDTGRLEIHDHSTGWRADLMGFGADNAKAFARLLAQ
ncbi:putative photosynthetic complex assembly protein [Sagittula marina]|uniref:Putative photosynthetic complex assembly protein n=1 Tax=Sagittula marina TaxID=943940 RepID=A0A7W6GW40_9RHOB|nr:photosynthetic complex assembly protein PuhC [Sagittula marina]MBB3988039.1 putative photosynthetic complex assembly protein [Sagittula marina]